MPDTANNPSTGSNPAPGSKSPSAWVVFIVNVLAPVLILDHCSTGAIDPFIRMPEQSFWQIGPLWAMIIALSLPIGYGIYSLIVQKKFELMSAVGMTGIVLTGLISLFVINRDGHIHTATPWLFAGKEALIPLFLAAAILASSRTATPLLKTFIYNPDVFDIGRIEQAVEQNGRSNDYDSLLMKSTWILAGTLVLSSAGNFLLSLRFMKPVLLVPVSEQQLQYNHAISNITWWGFLIIGVPLLAALLFILFDLVKKLGRITNLSRDQILLIG